MHTTRNHPTKVLAVGAALAASLCTTHAMNITKAPFGKTSSGQDVELYTLTNDKGVEAGIITYGGIIVSLKTPDRNGNPGDIVLGFDSLKDYEERSPFFGCITGRYANRIAKGKFTLDGKEYTLATNNGPNHLHGGKVGFDKAVWKAETKSEGDAVSLVLTHTSPDGDEGYPGNLDVEVTYTLNNSNELVIDYKAKTDQPTVLNLTNHSYFNLEGHGSGNVLAHELQLSASKFTPTDDTAIPTGELRPVEGTPLDFTKGKPIGRDIESDYEQIVFGKGYDHNFVIDGRPGVLRRAATVRGPRSGRVLEILTTEPGVQLYTANFMEKMAGKDGATYDFRGAFCLETQHFPDSPNHPDFPTTVLRPGDTFRSTTVHRFTTK